jgi:hypothetical protein
MVFCLNAVAVNMQRLITQTALPMGKYKPTTHRPVFMQEKLEEARLTKTHQRKHQVAKGVGTNKMQRALHICCICDWKVTVKVKKVKLSL